jgi:hypothetical protein
VLHYVAYNEQISWFFDLLQIGDDAVLSIVLCFPEDGFDHLKSEVLFVLEDDVLHHLPISEADLYYFGNAGLVN